MHFASIAARGQSQEWLPHLSTRAQISKPDLGHLIRNCRLKTPSRSGDALSFFRYLPCGPTFSLPLCIHRILPFSQCWLPSLSDLEWPLLTLWSSHLGGGLQIKPSDLLITTVSLSFTRTRLRNSKAARHWGQRLGCSWTSWPALSSKSCLSGCSWALRVWRGRCSEWTLLLFLWA